MSEESESIMTISARAGSTSVDVLISAADFELVSRFCWRLLKPSGSRWPYAVAYRGKDVIFMHRLICDPPEGYLVDHINGKTLDNRRENLRPATVAQNAFNMRKHFDSSSPYKGVYKKGKRWTAKIQNRLIGMFSTAEHAAIAYNDAAMAIDPEFACLNDLSGHDLAALRSTMLEGARTKSSQYSGVSFIGGVAKPWRAVKRWNKVNHRLGAFATELEAALAVDNFALRSDLDVSAMNFPDWPVSTYRERTREQGVTGRTIKIRRPPSQ